MLIDYVTIKLRYVDCPDWAGWWRLKTWGDRICLICGRTGAVTWERSTWSVLRSDLHQISICASASYIQISGSPARVMGDGDAVFGCGESGRNLYSCVVAMLDFVFKFLHVFPFPHPRVWRISRVDITQNYDLGSLANVRIALKELSKTDGGRYRLSQNDGDTPYWNKNSSLQSSLSYAKGPHLRQMIKKLSYTGRIYSDIELALADRLIRLEHRLKRLFFYRLRESGKDWWMLGWQDLLREFDDFFGRMIGTVQAVDMTKHLDELMKMPHYNDKSKSVTESLAKSILRTLYSIQSLGRQTTMEMMPLGTWYRHLKYLRMLGYGDADLVKGNVSYLRRQIIMTPVSSWEEFSKAA